MLLTITYEGAQTQNLSCLLHKHYERAQQFELSYGKAYVFYPVVGDKSTTAALLLDVNPIDLARGKLGSKDGGLFDYVNDRPYTSTSFMSTAISRVFGTAMNGRCDKMQQLADTPLNLTACLYSLKDNGNERLAADLFEPLGYSVKTERTMLDNAFEDWGKSPYINLTISGTVKLSELLNHIYVLIPVFDKQKHYYISEDEVQKLLKHGEGWLSDHPFKELIAQRYFVSKRSYARKALNSLMEYESADDENNDNAEDNTEYNTEYNIEDNIEDNAEAAKETRTPLNTQRMETVKNAVLKSGAVSVIDLGCGEGKLTSLLLSEQQIKKVTACDVCVSVLEKAAARLHIDRMNEYKKNKLTLMQASLTYKDSRFEGYDCACVIEVIEHIEPMRIPAFERTVFEFAVPKTVIITTPNSEYNVNYENMKENELRHGDHRFEWTRAEFKKWTEHICQRFGYTCEISGIGENDEKFGSPTQMGVFTKNG